MSKRHFPQNFPPSTGPKGVRGLGEPTHPPPPRAGGGLPTLKRSQGMFGGKCVATGGARCEVQGGPRVFSEELRETGCRPPLGEPGGKETTRVSSRRRRRTDPSSLQGTTRTRKDARGVPTPQAIRPLASSGRCNQEPLGPSSTAVPGWSQRHARVSEDPEEKPTEPPPASSGRVPSPPLSRLGTHKKADPPPLPPPPAPAPIPTQKASLGSGPSRKRKARKNNQNSGRDNQPPERRRSQRSLNFRDRAFVAHPERESRDRGWRESNGKAVMSHPEKLTQPAPSKRSRRRRSRTTTSLYGAFRAAPLGNTMS